MMSLASLLSAYITLNILVALAFMGLRSWQWFMEKRKTEPSTRSLLKLHYTVFIILFGIILALPFFPRTDFFQPPIKIWTSESIKTFPNELKRQDNAGFLSVPTPNGNLSLNAKTFSIQITVLLAGILLFGLFKIFRDLKSLSIIRKNSFPIRRIGTLTVFVNDMIAIPFSTWLPGRADIILPTALLNKPLDFKMSIIHELQHHRQNDTKWIYVLWAMKLICLCNPFIYLWSRLISEIQEFACDETLVDLKKVESQQYARCLVEVAETANTRRYEPICAIGLIFLSERNILKRRIEKMINRNGFPVRKSSNLVIGAVIVSLMSAAAFASKAFIQDRRVSMSQAQKLAQKAQSNEFPIVVNDLVLKQLNRYIGTPEGREFMKLSLQRMENYRKPIQEKLNEYNVPAEFMAIPIVESGYQNLEQKDHKGWGAGLWMFIGSTARNFGLRVDSQVDERLNTELLTDAAMRLLKADYLQFKDWQLSLLAYNMGESKVLESIKKTGSRDAWKIVREGFENDKNYLPKIMAAIIIMKNPESVE
jgi:membrane-bound lytic murein transglycosylase D